MISVIIPVYNAVKYIQKCVESIQKQTFQDWELILVDDGSKDGSASLCDKLAGMDHRIRVIHQKNQGVSGARNTGIEAAIGEYIMFVDADDWIESNLCEQLMSGISNADLAIAGFYHLMPSGKKKNVFTCNSCYISLKVQLAVFFDNLYLKNFINSPCSKLYKRDIIGIQRFDKSVALGEDLLFNLEYLQECNTIFIIPFAGYNYNRMNEHSATRKFRESDISQVINLYQHVKKFQQKFKEDWSRTLAAEHALCLGEFDLMQLLMYSDLKITRKKELANIVFESEAFRFSAEKCRNLPLKYEIPRRLCLWKSFQGLRLFYGLKKKLSYWLRKK